MATVELDRQSIEKRDFPIGRRGYDPAAVDAHLRALATEVEELSRTLEHRAGESLGSSAGTYVNDRRVEGPTPLRNGDQCSTCCS